MTGLSPLNDPDRATAEVAESGMRLDLQVLGSFVSVIFDAGVTADLAFKLQQAWSRCLDTRTVGQLGVSEGLLLGIPEDQQRYRARVVASSGVTKVAADTFEQFAAHLTSVVTMSGIEAGAGELMMLHASGLADPQTGRTAALVGRSGMGKTTATRVLGSELGYLSDETVAVDRLGRVVPYAKPLSLVVGDPSGPKRQAGPDELGLCIAPAKASLAAVILLDRNPDVDEPKVTPLSHTDAIIELVPQTSSLARIRHPLRWLCSILDSCGGAVRITYREAEELLLLVPPLLERSASLPSWSPAVEEDLAQPQSGGPSGLLQRAEIIDAVEIPVQAGGETELVAVVGHRVIRMRGIAPAIWRALGTPAGLDGIAERIASEVHLPGGHETHLAEAVAQLEAHGVLART